MDQKNPKDQTELDHGPVYFSVVVAQIWGYSSCWLPHFKNHSTLFKDWLKLVKWSHALHSLVTTFITFNLIFGSSKTVKN